MNKKIRQHLISIKDTPKEDLDYLLNLSEKVSKASESDLMGFLKGKMVVSFFFENSTRTRNSFEQAARRLGAGVMNFSSQGSSVSKGETLLDTARTIRAMNADCLVVRHSCAGSSVLLSREVDLSVVNAGDGFHEHPTQALLDVFTLRKRFGNISGKKIVIIGDIAHSRVARSNIHLLRKMGAEIYVCAPPTLLPPHSDAMGVTTVYRPEEILGQVDVVMALRVQLERQNKMQLPTISEYSKFWGLTLERMKLMKKDAIILHPGPINRGVELDPEVADSPSSVILDQVANGVMVRMAVLMHVIEPEKTKEWFMKAKVTS